MRKTKPSGYDDYCTPKYAVEPILKYLKPNSTIWCPFDTEESYYVKVFEQNGHKVIHTHINNGQDFFEIDMPDCDYIISYPPYSRRNDVLERLFQLKKPFAMLMVTAGLFDGQIRFNLFRNNKFEILYFNKKITYYKDCNEIKPTFYTLFSTSYVCHNILPQQTVFEDLNRDNLYKDNIIKAKFKKS